VIRKATVDDCLDLAALSLQVWLHTYATQGLRAKISQYALSTFTQEHFITLINDATCAVWVYIQDDHLVGYIKVDLLAQFNGNENGYEVATLYVSEHFQGRGVGRQLLAHIESQHGKPYWLSTWVNNHQAIDFYRNLGFQWIGELNFELEGEMHQNHVFKRTEGRSTCN